MKLILNKSLKHGIIGLFIGLFVVVLLSIFYGELPENSLAIIAIWYCAVAFVSFGLQGLLMYLGEKLNHEYRTQITQNSNYPFTSLDDVFEKTGEGFCDSHNDSSQF